MLAEFGVRKYSSAKAQNEPSSKYVRIDTLSVSNTVYYFNIQNPFQTSVRSQGLPYLSTANNPQLKIKTSFFMDCLEIEGVFIIFMEDQLTGKKFSPLMKKSRWIFIL